MADGNQVRNAGFERRPHSTRPRSTLNKRYAGPYTRFQRGGLYRFRSDDTLFRPFRVT
jgi:hypothetical protein